MSYLGIRGFDSILRGGIPARAEVLLLAPEGPDRYLIGAHWLVEGLQRGERVLLVLSGENPDAFLARLGRMGVDVTAALASGSLSLVDWYTCWTQAVDGVVEEHRRLRASRNVEDLVAAIARTIPTLLPAPDRRAFVDVLPLALKALDEVQATEALASVRAPLADAGVTSIFAADRTMPDDRTNALLQTFHAVLDARSEGGDALGFAVLGVGGVKLSARYRRVRIREDEARVETEPAVRTFSCPICDARVPFEAQKCPSCGTPRSEMAVRSRPSGIMDYVESLGRKEGAVDRGRTSAAPAQPRPPGFINGTRAPPGRVNGTAPGRVNGIAPRGQTNGLQSATGRTNGLLDGVRRARGGITNGLTNGSGFTNGLGASRARTEARRSRWKLFLVPLLAASLLVSPFLVTESAVPERFAIDGSFSEWSGISGYTQDSSPGTNAAIALQEYKVVHDERAIRLYARVEGTWFADPTEVHALYAFIDRDGDASTGYRVRGIGADVLAAVEGSGRAITATPLREYADPNDRNNWSAWRSAGSIDAAVSQGGLEASIPWEGQNPDATILLLVDDGGGSQSYSAVAVGFDLGALRATVRSRANIVSRGTPDVLAVDLEAVGAPINVTGITVDVDGLGSVVPPNFPIELDAGENRTVTVRVDTSSTAPGALLEARVVGITTDPPRPVTISGGVVRAFVENRTQGKAVDGWFGDWGPELTADPDTGVSADRDIDQFAANRTGSDLFLYVDVKGEILAGSPIPVRRTKPTPGEPRPSSPATPSRVVGEDEFRVYVDRDRNGADGVPFLGLRGADFLLEIRGIQGEITSRRAFEWRDGWRPLADPDAATDARRMEASIPLSVAGAVEVVFESRGWDGPADATPVSGTRGVRAAGPSGYRADGRFAASFTGEGHVELAAGGATVGWSLPALSGAGGTRVAWSLTPTPVGVRYASSLAEIRYTISDSQLKEEVVLPARPSDLAELTFPFDLGGSGMFLLEDHAPPAILSDAGRVFEFPTPFAVDAQGTVRVLGLVVDVEGGCFRIPIPGDLLDTAAYPLVIDPVVTYTLENDGPSSDPGEQMGYSVAFGDFNGDGYADVLTGAPSNNLAGSGNSQGYAYVYYGPFANDTTPDVWINGTEANGQFGYSLAAGKFNNDAFWDALVARRSVSGLCTTCNVSIYHGSASWAGLENTPDVNFPPPSGPKNFGWSVAAGNIDDASYDDVLVSEPGHDNDGGLPTADGVVYVYRSPFGSVESSADVTLFPSSNASGQFGQSLAVAKIDSDAYADVVAGEPVFSSNGGRLHFFKGVGLATYSGNRFPNATITAPPAGGAGQFGKSVAAGKLNGDAYADILVGAPTKNSNDGNAYGYLANSDGSGLSSGASASVTLGSQSAGEQFGSAVLIADFSDDGTADAIVGAYNAAGGGTSRGRVYWFDDPLIDQTVDATLSGEQDSERFGWSLATAKFGNDARTQIAIGAYLWNDGSETDSGRVVVAAVPESPLLVGLAMTIVLAASLRRRRKAGLRPPLRSAKTRKPGSDVPHD